MFVQLVLRGGHQFVNRHDLVGMRLQVGGQFIAGALVDILQATVILDPLLMGVECRAGLPLN